MKITKQNKNLALRSETTSLLNGYYIISKTSTSINFEGKIIDYIVNDTDEIIKTRGNFSQQLIVEVCLNFLLLGFLNKIRFLRYFFFVKFLAGAKKIYNSIKYTYYTPTTELYEINTETKIDKNVVRMNQIETNEISEKKTVQVLLAKSDTELYEPDLKIRSQCDKLCNGKKRITSKNCRKNDRRECRSKVSNEPCNTECDLKYLHFFGLSHKNIWLC